MPRLKRIIRAAHLWIPQGNLPHVVTAKLRRQQWVRRRNATQRFVGKLASHLAPKRRGKLRTRADGIGKQVAANATKDKLKEKFGIEGEGDTTEEVLKDAAQKKAKEEVNKQLLDGLKKLFN